MYILYDISIIQPTLSMQRASWSWFPALRKLKGRPVLVLWPWGPSETSDCTDGSFMCPLWMVNGQANQQRV